MAGHEACRSGYLPHLLPWQEHLFHGPRPVAIGSGPLPKVTYADPQRASTPWLDRPDSVPGATVGGSRIVEGHRLSPDVPRWESPTVPESAARLLQPGGVQPPVHGVWFGHQL